MAKAELTELQPGYSEVKGDTETAIITAMTRDANETRIWALISTPVHETWITISGLWVPFVAPHWPQAEYSWYPTDSTVQRVFVNTNPSSEYREIMIRVPTNAFDGRSLPVVECHRRHEDPRWISLFDHDGNHFANPPIF